jgi:hypothetical protein
LRATSKSQGVYALWLASDPPVCLKVGVAGPRKGKGLRDRLSYHFRSDAINTVLAEHLAADLSSPWARDRNFKDRTTAKDSWRRSATSKCCPCPIFLKRRSGASRRSWSTGLPRDMQVLYESSPIPSSVRKRPNQWLNEAAKRGRS